MTDLQIELTKLIGSKELSLGCILESKEYNTWNTFLYDTFDNKIVTLGHQFPTVETWNEGELEVIGHQATLSDLHRFIKNRQQKQRGDKYTWEQRADCILYDCLYDEYNGDFIFGEEIDYDSTKDLLDQSEETLKQIIDFIKENQ